MTTAICAIFCVICLLSHVFFISLFLFFFFFHRATVIVNSQPVEKSLPLSILMSSLPLTGADAQEQTKERLSTGTKFALRQWIQFLYSTSPGGFQRGDSYGTVFQGITKAGHQPVKSPFWGKQKVSELLNDRCPSETHQTEEGAQNISTNTIFICAI